MILNTYFLNSSSINQNYYLWEKETKNQEEVKLIMEATEKEDQEEIQKQL